jgi:hypothetical protein
MSTKKPRHVAPVQLNATEADQLAELSKRSGHSRADLLRFFIGTGLDQFAGKPVEVALAIVHRAEMLANSHDTDAAHAPSADEDDDDGALAISPVPKRAVSSSKKR